MTKEKRCRKLLDAFSDEDGERCGFRAQRRIVVIGVRVFRHPIDECQYHSEETERALRRIHPEATLTISSL